MPAVFDTIGIQSVTGSLIESVDYEKSLEEAMVLASDSGFGHAEAFNPTGTFSVKGSGNIPGTVTLGGAAGAPDSFTGGIILVTSIKEEEKNDAINSFEYSGVWAPGASSGE